MKISLSKQTVRDCSKYSRQILSDSVDPLYMKICGSGIWIEADETIFGKRKYNRMHRVEKVYVIAGIEQPKKN